MSDKKKNKFLVWLQKLPSYVKNKTINMLGCVLAIFIIGGTNYWLMFQTFIPTIFPLDFFIMLLIFSPIFFFQNTMFDRIYIPIILLLITVFYCINGLYFDYYHVVLSLKDIPTSIENISQVMVHASEINYWIVAINIILFGFFASSTIVFNVTFNFQKKRIKKNFNLKTKIFASIFLASSLVFFEFSLAMVSISEKSKKHFAIDYVNYSPDYYFKYLGMMSYYTKEIRQLIFDRGATLGEIRSFLNDGKYLNDDFTDWFNQNGIPKPNIFVIMIETGDEVMLNSTLTPNLYSLLNDGIDCNLSFSVNLTNISERCGIVGNVPSYTPQSTTKYYAPFSLPNLLREWYKTYYYQDIDVSEDSYRDDLVMPALGFETTWFHNHILPDKDPWKYMWVNYTRDSEVMDGILKDVKKFPSQLGSQPFYLHWTTMFMHQNQVRTPQNKEIINSIEKDFGDKVREAERNGQWSNPFTNASDKDRFWIYTLKTMDFDRALGNLMDTLYGDAAPEYLKNSLLVVYGDHHWSEKTSDEREFGSQARKCEDEENIHTYSTISGLYHPLLNQYFFNKYNTHKLNKPSWPTCIPPTILDLLGVKYNPRWYQSRSIFDPESINDVFYSNKIRKYFNDHYTSSNGINITRCILDNQTQNDFLQNMRYTIQQMRVLDGIYRKNIFKTYKLEDFLPKENLCFTHSYYLKPRKYD